MNAEFNIGGTIIETERLLLRAFQQTDLQDFYEYASVEGVGEMAGWPHHESIEKTQEILDMFIEGDHDFAICLKSNGKVIGSLGVKEYGLEDKLTEFYNYRGREIGYVLSKDYWGQGLMPEAVNAVIDYLFNTLGLDFVQEVYATRVSVSKLLPGTDAVIELGGEDAKIIFDGNTYDIKAGTHNILNIELILFYS